MYIQLGWEGSSNLLLYRRVMNSFGNVLKMQECGMPEVFITSWSRMVFEFQQHADCYQFTTEFVE